MKAGEIADGCEAIASMHIGKKLTSLVVSASDKQPENADKDHYSA